MITFVYVTNRKYPQWKWYIDSLYQQCKELKVDDYEVLFIDEMANHSRNEELNDLIYGRFKHWLIMPKPCRWSGRSRKTKINYFSASNARNTALIAAKGEHVVFSDDLSLLGKNYVSHHVAAAMNGIIMAGIQKKLTGMIVENGELISFSGSNDDSRQKLLDNKDAGTIEALCPSWLYGNNFSMPIQFAEDVNGYDEIMDGQYGVEDCDFGIRLHNAGHKIYFNQHCVLLESQDHHVRENMASNSKEINGRHANESVCWEARDSGRSWTLGNRFNLKDARAMYKIHGGFPLEDDSFIDWRDGQLLSSM